MIYHAVYLHKGTTPSIISGTALELAETFLEKHLNDMGYCKCDDPTDDSLERAKSLLIKAKIDPDSFWPDAKDIVYVYSNIDDARAFLGTCDLGFWEH